MNIVEDTPKENPEGTLEDILNEKPEDTIEDTSGVYP
jgi:hypothetical protein